MAGVPAAAPQPAPIQSRSNVPMEVHDDLHRRVAKRFLHVEHRLSREQEQTRVGVTSVVDANRANLGPAQQPVADLEAKELKGRVMASSPCSR
jgi:hypothetical protein